uniref:Uncharacterized protein n=1 Tax=Romanomermis culicivorax TaxID=13658 RepID=A0A915LBP2_ROMCU
MMTVIPTTAMMTTSIIKATLIPPRQISLIPIPIDLPPMLYKEKLCHVLAMVEGNHILSHLHQTTVCIGDREFPSIEHAYKYLKLARNLLQFGHVLEQMYHICMVLSVVLPHKGDEKMERRLVTFGQNLR